MKSAVAINGGSGIIQQFDWSPHSSPSKKYCQQSLGDEPLECFTGQTAQKLGPPHDELLAGRDCAPRLSSEAKLVDHQEHNLQTADPHQNDGQNAAFNLQALWWGGEQIPASHWKRKASWAIDFTSAEIEKTTDWKLELCKPLVGRRDWHAITTWPT